MFRFPEFRTADEKSIRRKHAGTSVVDIFRRPAAVRIPLFQDHQGVPQVLVRVENGVSVPVPGNRWTRP